ncbi:MAG: HD domain-containing protein [Gemmataceae bacterium]|nr:HD domain-containing protein [Gemmataceae bacterium]
MTDTKVLLKRIADLRMRLEQAHAKKTQDNGGLQQGQPADVETTVRAGAWQNTLLDSVLREITADGQPAAAFPAKLTARAARLLHRGRDLLHDLRGLLEDPILQAEETDPLSSLHAETAAMLDVVLRTVQAFPPSPGAQLRLCQGLECTLALVEHRLGLLHASLSDRRAASDDLEKLTQLLRKAGAGQAVALAPFLEIGDSVVEDARANKPLRFLCAGAEDSAKFAAAHSLNVAQVLARLLLVDEEGRRRFDEVMLAALVHDAGLARVPAEILATPGPLTDEKRRILERHCAAGAAIVQQILPGGGLAVEAARDHHERVDGTGYPAGKKDLQLDPLVKLLAVCDVYAALCARRPYRPAHDTRTALTDTLLLADQGALDKNEAEKLLSLSFYPAGSAVELSDGSAAVVLGTHPGEVGLVNPAKPVVWLLHGPRHQALAMPLVVDLVLDGRSVVRGLGEEERRAELLGRYPALI